MSTTAVARKDAAVMCLHMFVEAMNEEEGPAAPKGLADDVRVRAATSLRLSFLSIAKCESLTSMTALRELRLDNNNLTTIEGLDTLVNLQLLDLSFNHIKRIEGLSTLTRLEDLSLYNNLLTDLGGLAGCPKLVCVSLGNNAITKQDEVVKLVELAELRVLNMDGNPCARDRIGFRRWCLSMLPWLKYLDYALVTAGELAAAAEYGASPEMVRHYHVLAHEKHAAIAAEAAAAAAAADLRHHSLDGSTHLPAELVEEDPETCRTATMPGAQGSLDDFITALRSSTEEYHAAIREVHRVAQDELDSFDAAIEAAATEALVSHRTTVGAWEQEHAKLALRAHREDTPTMAAAHDDLEALGALETACRDSAAAVRKEEFHRHKGTMKALDVLDTALSTVKADAVAQHDRFYAQVEALGEQLHAALIAHGETLIAAVEGRAVPSGVDEDMRNLAASRVTLTAALQAAHDSRLSKVLRRATDARKHEEAFYRGEVEARGQRAVDLNRARLQAVHDWEVACASRIATLRATLEEQAEDARAAAAAREMRPRFVGSLRASSTLSFPSGALGSPSAGDGMLGMRPLGAGDGAGFGVVKRGARATVLAAGSDGERAAPLPPPIVAVQQGGEQ